MNEFRAALERAEVALEQCRESCDRQAEILRETRAKIAGELAVLRARSFSLLDS